MNVASGALPARARALDAFAKSRCVVALRGVTAIVVGSLAMLAPGPRSAALAWLIGVYAIAFGTLLVGLSLALRRWRFDEGGEP